MRAHAHTLPRKHLLTHLRCYIHSRSPCCTCTHACTLVHTHLNTQAHTRRAHAYARNRTLTRVHAHRVEALVIVNNIEVFFYLNNFPYINNDGASNYALFRIVRQWSNFLLRAFMMLYDL